MKTKIVFLLAFAASVAFGQGVFSTWVYPPTGQIGAPGNPYALPVDGMNGALVYNPMSNVPVMLTNGWRIERAAPAVQSGYVRFWNSPAWTYDANGTNANASYVDVTQASLDATAASNAAVQAASNAAAYTAQQVAWTNACLAVTNSAHPYRLVMRLYKGIGSESNSNFTHAVMENYFSSLMFDAQPATSNLLTNVLIYERGWNALAPLCPSGDTASFPWSIVP